MSRKSPRLSRERAKKLFAAMKRILEARFAKLP